LNPFKKFMPPRQAAYLLDILRSLEVIQDYLAGQTREQFLGNVKTQDAVLRRRLVIGEAAARLTPESCAEFPGIPFPLIVGDGQPSTSRLWPLRSGHYLGDRGASLALYPPNCAAFLKA
jgi:hypothetical protein